MNNKVWKFILSNLERGVPSVLIVVADTKGSTPSKPGFKMAVTSEGPFEGTVGGGLAEHELINIAKEMLYQGRPAPKLVRQVHNSSRSGDESGMICGGEQTVILYPFKDTGIESLREIADAVNAETRASIVINPKSIALIEGAPGRTVTFDMQDNLIWRYEEGINAQSHVYIVGGGHVSLALSRVLAMLDFNVTVFDDRDDVQTLRENRYADEKILIPFERAGEKIPDGEDTYVAIMTPSHQADESVLRSLIKRKFRYLGMMASSIKIKEVFESMKKDGFNEEDLKKVRTPIGIPINSNTPEEIAVSIAAEMIKTRNS